MAYLVFWLANYFDRDSAVGVLVHVFFDVAVWVQGLRRDDPGSGRDIRSALKGANGLAASLA